MSTRSLIAILLLLSLPLIACGDSPREESGQQAVQAQTQPAAAAGQKEEEKQPEPIKNATAVIHTDAGDMRCQLFGEQTPKTVANFVGLAEGTKTWKHPASGAIKRNTPLYDGTIFHRVIPNFMIQAGDPLGTGVGGPGYEFEDEIVRSLKFDRPGRLAMANSGPNTNGSQFFITEVPTPHLNGKHTIFGQCDDDSVRLVRQIARKPRSPRDERPLSPIHIKHIEIIREHQPEAQKPSR